MNNGVKTITSGNKTVMQKIIHEQDRVILENIDPAYRYKGIAGEHDELVEMYRKSLHELLFR